MKIKELEIGDYVRMQDLVFVVVGRSFCQPNYGLKTEATVRLVHVPKQRFTVTATGVFEAYTEEEAQAMAKKALERGRDDV